MSKELDYLMSAENLLAVQEPLAENGAEYRAIIGYNNNGKSIETGVYYFHEVSNEGVKRQTLTQDTLNNLVPVRGVMIENGEIIKSLGLGKLHGEALANIVRDFFGAFNKCYLYKEINKT